MNEEDAKDLAPLQETCLTVVVLSPYPLGFFQEMLMNLSKD